MRCGGVISAKKITHVGCGKTRRLGAYERHLETEKPEIVKQNIHKIENDHLNLRTRIKRLARRTICFDKAIVMHDEGAVLKEQKDSGSL